MNPATVKGPLEGKHIACVHTVSSPGRGSSGWRAGSGSDPQLVFIKEPNWAQISHPVLLPCWSVDKPMSSQLCTLTLEGGEEVRAPGRPG